MFDLNGELPSFDCPPLTEVVVSVQFDQQSNLKIPQIGLLWSRFKKHFPKTEHLPPLEQVVERFDTNYKPSAQISVSTVPPIARCCFISDDESESIQIQTDRFIHTWRKVNPNDEYPRYSHIRNQFQKNLDEFSSFLSEENVGEIKANQCELRYVNMIDSNKIWSNHSQLNKVLTLWNPICSDKNLLEIENVRINTQHILFDDDGNPEGRMYISTEPMVQVEDNRPSFLISLSVRGAPRQQSCESVLTFLDKAHTLIVKGFVSITTDEMHKYWKRTK